MIRYSVRFANYDEFVKKLKRRERSIKEEAVREINRIGVLAESELRATAPRDTSYMARGIDATTATLANPIVEIRAAAKYTEWVDKGTRPHMPPVAPLIPWAKRHPYKDYPPEVTAFLVARAIARRGTKPRNFVDPVLRKLETDLRAVETRVRRMGAL